MKGPPSARTAALAALLFAACGPNRDPTPEAGEAGRSDATFADFGPPDIIVRDYSLPPLDGLALDVRPTDTPTTLSGACNALMNVGGPVPTTHVSGALPAPAGGDLVQGYYVLTAINVYDPAPDGGGRGGGPLTDANTDAGAEAPDASTDAQDEPLEGGADAGAEASGSDASAEGSSGDATLDAPSADAGLDASADSAADARVDARRDVSLDFAVFQGRAASMQLGASNAYGILTDPGVDPVTFNATFTATGANLQWTFGCATAPQAAYDGYTASDRTLQLWINSQQRVETWTRR